MIYLRIFQTVLDANTHISTENPYLSPQSHNLNVFIPPLEPTYERHRLAGVWYLSRVSCQLLCPSGQSGIRIAPPPRLCAHHKATLQPKVVTPGSRPRLTPSVKLESEGIKAFVISTCMSRPVWSVVT